MSLLYKIHLTKIDVLTVQADGPDEPKKIAQRWVNDIAKHLHHGEKVSARVAVVEDGKERFFGDEIEATEHAE